MVVYSLLVLWNTRTVSLQYTIDISMRKWYIYIYTLYVYYAISLWLSLLLSLLLLLLSLFLVHMTFVESCCHSVQQHVVAAVVVTVCWSYDIFGRCLCNIHPIEIPMRGFHVQMNFVEPYNASFSGILHLSWSFMWTANPPCRNLRQETYSKVALWTMASLVCLMLSLICIA